MTIFGCVTAKVLIKLDAKRSGYAGTVKVSLQSSFNLLLKRSHWSFNNDYGMPFVAKINKNLSFSRT